MLRINFKLTNTLKKEYIKILCSAKFGKGNKAQTVKERFEEYKKKRYPFNIVFCDLTFEEIVFMKPEDINCLILKLETRMLEQTELVWKKNDKNKSEYIYSFKAELHKLFKYDGKFQPLLASFFEQHLKPRTCYYCNIDFVNVYKNDEGIMKNKFTLDHFIDKGKYPYLALSLFNLVPSCYICNSKIKGMIKFYEDPELKNTNPYLESFDFNEKTKFKLFLNKKSKNLNIKSKNDIAIPLKERYSNKYEKYIDIFQLNERYEAHRDIVFEMMQNVELYPDSRLKELENLTGVPYQQIKKDIFNLIDKNIDLSKQPFSKLIKDIAIELGLR